jgi:hypothetical protein
MSLDTRFRGYDGEASLFSPPAGIFKGVTIEASPLRSEGHAVVPSSGEREERLRRKPVKRSNLLLSMVDHGETSASAPSLLQGQASIDTVSWIVHVP